MSRRYRPKASKQAGDNDVWPQVRPWVLGMLGFVALLILGDRMFPRLLDMWPLVFMGAYCMYALVYTVVQLNKPRHERDWSGLLPGDWSGL